MRKILLLFIAFGFNLLVAPSCQNSTKTASDSDSVKDAALRKAYNDTLAMARERDEYRFSVQQHLNRVQAKVDSLDAKMKTESRKEANEDWQKNRAGLQRDIDQIKTDLKVYGNKVAPDWENFKTKVNRSLDTLSNNLEKALRPSGRDATPKHTKARKK